MQGIKIVFTIAGLFIAGVGFSQDTISISKAEVLEKVTLNNLQNKISQYNYESSRADYRESNSLFLPDISVSYTGMTTTNPLMAFGSKLNQESLKASDFDPALLNDPDRINNFATRIEVMQPLINADGIMERKAAKAKSEAVALQMERTKEHLTLEATKAYIQLQLAYKTVIVLEKANVAGKANLKLIENYFAQGLLQKTDLLSMQVRMTEIENQLQYAKSNVHNASDYLSFLFNDTNSTKVYRPVDDLTNLLEINNTAQSIPENRKDFLAMDKSIYAYENMLKSGKMKFLPRLNAFGSYELYDPEIFKAGANGYVVGAQLKWNLFDGYKSYAKSDNANLKLQRQKAEAEQYRAKSQMEFNQTKRQLTDAENKIQLSESAFNQMKEAYKIKKDRFEQGLEKTNDLLYAETQMLQKELEHLQSVFEYNYTVQYLQFLTK